MINKSPCVTCDKKNENKEDYNVKSCATDCGALRLHQAAHRIASTLGAPEPGQCLICRCPTTAAYCERCRKRYEGPQQPIVPSPRKIQKRSDRVCECGEPATHGERCQRCYNSWQYHIRQDPSYVANNRHRYYSEVQVTRGPRECEVCHGVIPQATGCLTRRVNGLRKYAHRGCVEKNINEFTIKRERRAA